MIDGADSRQTLTVELTCEHLWRTAAINSVHHDVIVTLSARNQLEDKVVEVQLDDIMAHVVVKIGNSQVESVITRLSAEQLALTKGDKMRLVIKSTEVMLGDG